MALAQIAEQSGPAWSGFLYGVAIGAGGVSIQRPGIGEAWTIFNPRIKAFPLFLHRTIKSHLESIIENLDEVYSVSSGDCKWLVKLGFEMCHVEQFKYPEILHKLTPNQTILVRRSDAQR